MAMDQEARAEALDTYKLMSADELNAQLGDDAEHDALIQEVLAKGNAVEVKGSQVADDEHSGQAGTHHSIGAGNEDDDEGEGEGVAEVAAVVGEDPAKPAAETVDETAAVDPVAEVPEVAPEAAPAVELAPLDLSYLDAKRDAEFAKLDAAKAEGLTKLMAGEIEAADYAKIDAQYMRDRDAVRESLKDEAAWVTEAHGFKATALAATGINYDADKEKAGALDDWLKRLAEKPETANWTGQQFLQAAHKKVLAEFDIAPKAAAAPAAAPATPAPAVPVVKKGRAPDLSGIPPTLGSLPAAASPGSGDGGEFAHLSTLSGIKLEQALARLTADQQDRYLSE